MFKSRTPKVAGAFYPGGRAQIEHKLSSFFGKVSENLQFEEFKQKFLQSKQRIFGIIVPHAGWVYSGLIAAYAYDLIKDRKFKKFILIGPNHTVELTKAAVDDSDFWETPLGKVKVMKTDLKDASFVYSGMPHKDEHDLEVQIPFLQYLFGDKGGLANFEILPIIAGNLTATQIRNITEELLRVYDTDTLFIFSTDLSHYMSYDDAQKRDSDSIRIVQNLDFAHANMIDACGKIPLLIAMSMCLRLGAVPTPIKYATSAETSNDYNSVVGYVSMFF